LARLATARNVTFRVGLGIYLSVMRARVHSV
jgi:hypothetical protein